MLRQRSDVKIMMNRLGRERKPFLFVIDYEMENPLVLTPDEIDDEALLYFINGITNVNHEVTPLREEIGVIKRPVSAAHYSQAFDVVMENLIHGNSYLLNLTQPTSIECNVGLKDIFLHSEAMYKLWVKDSFVVFSPEIFVRISSGKIFSFPMKGTIDADVPDAREIILNDPKELAEQYTIVDLIRNDLSRVAENVRVSRFRYIDEVYSKGKNLLQVSSEVQGDLPVGYQNNIGDILFELLPAGSITGAPKKKTMEVIKEAEGYRRGYYTGVAGWFDGENLDSFVMIRYIEQGVNGLVYKSGGGITVNSICEKEYQELIDKVYVPINRDLKN